jgi:hypothetical protein
VNREGATGHKGCKVDRAAALSPAEVALLLFLASLALAAPEPVVTVSGATWARLQPAPPAIEAPPAARVVRRDARISWDGEVIRVRATWSVDADRPEWMVLPLFGPGVHLVDARWNGARANVLAEGGARAIGWVVGPTTITAEGVLPADPTRGAVALQLGGAAAGEVRVQTPAGLVGTVRAPGAVALPDRVLTGADALTFQVGPPVQRARDRGRLAVASTGIGLTVGEGAVEGRARIVWALRQGSLDRVSFTARGVGPDLQVTGSQVASWSRAGDRVDVVLRERESASVALALRWSVPLPEGEVASVALPEIAPGEAFRSESSVQIARDAEIEVVPELRGWEPISAYDLPDYGVGLVQGAPTAAFRAGAGGRSGALALLRYVPAEQPPVMVDVASHVVAVAADGRALSRVLLTARNERAPYLRVRLPEGHRIIAARVDGRATNLVDDGDGLRVPLPRSLETLEGLISFPIELVTLGEMPAWERREQRSMRVLAVDAPIAVSRVSVHLPPGFASELPVGDAGIVDDFTEGETLAYGFGLGGEAEARADALWQQALQSYMRNEFDAADALLDDIQALGADNENLDKLKANLDVVQGRGGGAADPGKDVQARRVVAQAASRGIDDLREQEEARVEAEREYQAGNYAAADEKYRKVEDLAKKLGKVEQAESVEQSRNVAVSKSRRDAAGKARDVYEREVRAAEVATIAFDDVEIDGSFLAPSATYAADGWIEAEGAGSVEGGVVGGVAGGILGGASEPRPEPAPPPPPDELRVIDQELLARVPAGRSYQSAVQGVAGEVAPTVEGASANENTYLLDGGAITDPVTGTYSVNFSALEQRSAPRRTNDVERSSRAPKGAAAPPPSGGGRAGARRPTRGPIAGDDDLDDMVYFEDNLEAPEVVAPDPYAFEALQVASTAESVVIPVLGQTVHYQHLLLPAGAEHAVRIEARAPRSSIRSPR